LRNRSNTLGSFIDKEIRRNYRLDRDIVYMGYMKYFKQTWKKDIKHIKGVIRSCKWKDRQYNDQTKKDKKTNNDP
jgi:hypothetical protein